MADQGWPDSSRQPSFAKRLIQLIAYNYNLLIVLGMKGSKRLRASFFIEHDRAAVRDFVRACATCQRNKTETLNLEGLLQPLPVPSQVWSDISMDFVEGLPKVHGKSVIPTVVDRFSKFAHFIAVGHPYTAATVAKAFFEGIVGSMAFENL